jgi:hypothetical protein
MGYTRTEVRQALSKAKAEGRDCTALHVDARDTEITLEKWGFLPVDSDRLDARMRDWYVSQGLAVRVDDSGEPQRKTRREAVPDAPVSPFVNVSQTEAAMTAAQAALTAAQAALTLARSMQPPAA